MMSESTVPSNDPAKFKKFGWKNRALYNLRQKFSIIFVLVSFVIGSHYLIEITADKFLKLINIKYDDSFDGTTKEKASLLIKVIDLCGQGDIKSCINGEQNGNILSMVYSLRNEIRSHELLKKTSMHRNSNDKNMATLERKHRSIASTLLLEADSCASQISDYVRYDKRPTSGDYQNIAESPVFITSDTPRKINTDCESTWSIFFHFVSKDKSMSNGEVSVQYDDASGAISDLSYIFRTTNNLNSLPEETISSYENLISLRSNLKTINSMQTCLDLYICKDNIKPAIEKTNGLIQAVVFAHSTHAPQEKYRANINENFLAVIKYLMLLSITFLTTIFGDIFFHDFVRSAFDNP